MLTESQRLVKEMIESVYIDGMDAIGTPELSEDGKILICEFQDGEKLLEAKIFIEKEKDDIEIKMLNPEVLS